MDDFYWIYLRFTIRPTISRGRRYALGFCTEAEFV